MGIMNVNVEMDDWKNAKRSDKKWVHLES